MATKSIIVPTDFSAESELALEYAEMLAGVVGARLVIVHVQELPIVPAEASYRFDSSSADDGGVEAMLESVKPSSRGIAYEHRLVFGDPASRIAALADDEHAEMIVMSLRRNGRGRSISGTLTEAVMHAANCPVLVVNEQADVGSSMKAEASAFA